jgi:hypothetical protein
MDFNQAEQGIMWSAIPYMYGAPQKKLKGAIVQVQTGPWMQAQRDKGNAYRALKSLTRRQVFRATEKGRYILNTRYGEWLDKNGRQVFSEGSEALAGLQTLLAIRPYWRGTDAGQDVPTPDAGDAIEQPDDAPAQVSDDTPEGVAQHPERCSTTPEKVLDNTPEGCSTTPEKVLHNTHQRPPSPENGTGAAVTDSKCLQEGESKQQRTPPARLFDYAKAVCLLSPNELADLAKIAADVDTDALTAALERLACATSRPLNPIGYVRSLTTRITQGERITPAKGANTFAEYCRHAATKERLRAAFNDEKRLTSTTEAEAARQAERLAKIARPAMLKGNADAQAIHEAARKAQEHHTRKAERELKMRELAQAFTDRAQSQQLGVIDEARRARITGARVNIETAEKWIQAGRPAWRAAPIPHLAEALAYLEETGRRFFDPALETVEIQAPGRRS